MIKLNLTISVISLKSNPLRSFLTMSGIIIGIAAVVAVLSIGKGHQEKIEAQIRKMGSNVFWIEADTSPSISSLSVMPFYGLKNMQRTKRLSKNSSLIPEKFLSNSDAKAIKKRCTAVKWSAPVTASFANGMLNGKPVTINVIGTSPEYIKVNSIKILSGRYISYEDMQMLNDVCVIELNPGNKFIYRKESYIFVNSRRFKIIGVVKRENFQINSNALFIHIPLNVVQTELTGSTTINLIYCLSKNNLLETAKKQVEIVLQSRHEGEINFEIRSTRDVYNRAETLTRTATMVTAGIGMISLFVGGIGIMNILLASVFERIKEIGIRRSVGARKKDILLQFLFESITLTVLGGIIGVICGVIVTKIISAEIELPSVVSYESFLVGIVTSSLIGILFGIYPALKASNFAPIESLRYE